MRRHALTLVAGALALAVMCGASSATAEAEGLLHLPEHAPAALIILFIALATFVSEDLTVIATGVLVASDEIPFGVGLAGCFLGIAVGDFGLWALGRFAGRRILKWPVISGAVSQKSIEKWGRVLDQHTGKAILLSRVLPGTRLPTYVAAGILGRHTRKFMMWLVIAVGIWTPFLLTMSILIGGPLLAFFEGVLHGPWAIMASLFILYVLVRLVGYETTDTGRQRLKADLRKIVAHEFWPFWFFYLPLVPWLCVLALRYKPTTFTCANPGIVGGGGVVGESKTAICRSMSGAAPVAPTGFVPAGGTPDERARAALAQIAGDEALGGYPIVLKPDASERGAGVRVAKTEADVRDYFETITGDVQIQKHNPGPVEVGILWSRVPSSSGATRADECPGEIFSITRKVFPSVVGDGESTLEQLIWRHPRYRCQADVFLKRFDDRTDEVVPEGETFVLGTAGNHAQGARFEDASDLRTEALSRVFEEICQSFAHPETGAGLDFGRFDVRATSEEALKAGRGFEVIELNGVLSESTNMYDPSRSVVWCYSVLFAQWRRVFRLGAMRRREGARPLGKRALWRMVRGHLRSRPSGVVAD